MQNLLVISFLFKIRIKLLSYEYCKMEEIENLRNELASLEDELDKLKLDYKNKQ